MHYECSVPSSNHPVAECWCENYPLSQHPVTKCLPKPEISTFKTSSHRMLVWARIIHFPNIQSQDAGPSQNYPLSKHPITGCWSEPELSTFKTSSHRMLVWARIIHSTNSHPSPTWSPTTTRILSVGIYAEFFHVRCTSIEKPNTIQNRHIIQLFKPNII